MLSRIFFAKNNYEHNECKRRTNAELMEVINKHDIVCVLKSRRFSWV